MTSGHSIVGGKYTTLLESVARFTERRQDLLAGNIANIDTPDYRARDLDVANFREQLAAAVRDNDRSLFSQRDETAQDLLRDASQNLTFHDGADRSIEHEVSEMTKNMLDHMMSLNLLAHQMNMMRLAITGRNNR